MSASGLDPRHVHGEGMARQRLADGPFVLKSCSRRSPVQRDGIAVEVGQRSRFANRFCARGRGFCVFSGNLPTLFKEEPKFKDGKRNVFD